MARKRPIKEQTLKRDQKAWQLRQKGYTQEQIAQQLKCDQGTISRALDKLNDKYLAQALNQVERVKVEQTRILWWVVSEALRAWEESKKPLSRVSADEDGKTVTQATGREGSVQYLHTARAAMADIRSIWGADVAPATQDNIQGIAQLVADIEARANAFTARKATEAVAPPAGSLPSIPGKGSDGVQGGPSPIQ